MSCVHQTTEVSVYKQSSAPGQHGKFQTKWKLPSHTVPDAVSGSDAGCHQVGDTAAPDPRHLSCGSDTNVNLMMTEPERDGTSNKEPDICHTARDSTHFITV